MADVVSFFEFDIYHNDIFYFGSKVFGQKRGLAIEGTGSAQMASICLFMSGHQGYPCLPPLPFDKEGQHPCDLPVHPFRFRDNLVGVKYKSTPIENIPRGFEHIYNILLQVENVGHTLTSLESDL